MVILDGGKIVRLRVAKGYGSQRMLADATRTIDAEATGVSPRLVWDAEHGKPVSLRTHALIARALTVNPDELVALGDAAAGGLTGDASRRLKSGFAFIGIAIAVAALSVVLVVGLVHRPVGSRVVRAELLPLPHLFVDMRAKASIASNMTLKHDLLCGNLTILAGVTLNTDGHNIFCSGSFRNAGEIVTGYSGFQDYPVSYGGAGGAGAACGPRRVVPGFSTLASTISGSRNGAAMKLPTLSRALLRRWYRIGLRHLLAGAAGGGGSLRAGQVGGPGAYGLYIQARRVDAGIIRASGLNGCSGRGTCGSAAGGGGGGGAIILAYGSAGLVPGRYLTRGGSGSMGSCGTGGRGGSGSAAMVSFGRMAPIVPMPERDPSSDVPPMRITNVIFSARGTMYTVTIVGSGFGTIAHIAGRRKLHRFRIANSSERFEAGYSGDRIPLDYRRWSPRRIVVAGFHAYPGDCIAIGIWNPATHQAAAWGGNVPPVPVGVPHISSARVAASGEVTILGSGFGATPSRVPFASNQNLVILSDLAYHSTNSGPSILYSVGGTWTPTMVLVDYWSNTKIEIAGIKGSNGLDKMRIERGDPVSVEVQNIWSKTLTGWGGVAQ